MHFATGFLCLSLPTTARAFRWIASNRYISRLYMCNSDLIRRCWRNSSFSQSHLNQHRWWMIPWRVVYTSQINREAFSQLCRRTIEEAEKDRVASAEQSKTKARLVGTNMSLHYIFLPRISILPCMGATVVVESDARHVWDKRKPLARSWRWRWMFSKITVFKHSALHRNIPSDWQIMGSSPPTTATIWTGTRWGVYQAGS